MRNLDQSELRSESDPSIRPQLFPLNEATESSFGWVKSRRPSLKNGRQISFLSVKAQLSIPSMDGSELDSDRAESMSDVKDDIPAKSAPTHDLADMGGRKGDKFDPFDLQKEPKLDSGLPPELWTIIQAAPANFTPQYFLEVSRNLLENPNLTASHLARAELSYSSFTDATFNPAATHPHELAGMIKHMKADHQPLLLSGGVREYKLEWTVVRKLIPRNPKLDQPLLQSCHLYASTSTVVVTSPDGTTHQIEADRYMIVYLPHVTSPDTIPFYHPKVRALAILYAYHPTASASSYSGTLSLYYNLFPSYPLDNRLSRTALKMLEIIHKHSRGRQAGYTKRVHHDQIIPQKRFQDTYAHLKGKYAKPLIENWVEQTPASKHVFEDLGIAAFLIELWTDMYSGKNRGVSSSTNAVSENTESEFEEQWRTKARQNFPGFVDIGCGNGLLVYILNQEGWDGWGFDARRRKTWDTFAPTASFSTDKLKEMLLVPEVLNTNTDTDNTINGIKVSTPGPATHNGIFPSPTFIISNHADELTAWTPMLAFLSESPFIAIPCCSHNFGGTRFRAPDRSAKRSSKKAALTASDASTSQKDIGIDASAALCATKSTASPASPDPSTSPGPSSPSTVLPAPPAAKPTHKPPKPPSAYASLCAYTCHLTTLIHYIPEKEHLRIPSTRNIAILGREKRDPGTCMGNMNDKLQFVREIVEREMADSAEGGIEQVRLLWLKRGGGLVKGGKGDGGEQGH